MSPTVPPISVITTSTSSSAARREDPVLDLVGDVRDHLHGLAEVGAAPLLGEHRLVDRAGGRVEFAGERHVDEALVVPEVEVGLAAVVGDEHLAVLEGVHRAGVDVDVGVELLHRDPQAPGLQQPPERGGGEALPEARGHATGHEDVLRQDLAISRRGRREITTAGDRTMRPPDDLAHRYRARSDTAAADAGAQRSHAPPGRTGAARGTGGSTRSCSRSSRSCSGSPRSSPTRSLVFDDGVFASSALAMRDGELPFRDVFSSQGPVFLPLLWVADLVGFRTLDAPRLLIGRVGRARSRSRSTRARAASRRAATRCSRPALVTTSGSVLWVTGPVNADGPSLALSVLAVALAFALPRRPTPRHAVWSGSRPAPRCRSRRCRCRRW